LNINNYVKLSPLQTNILKLIRGAWTALLLTTKVSPIETQKWHKKLNI